VRPGRTPVVRVGGTRLVSIEVANPGGPECRCGSPASTARSSRTHGSSTPLSDEDGNVSAPSDLDMAAGRPMTTEVRVEREEVGGHTRRVLPHSGNPHDPRVPPDGRWRSTSSPPPSGHTATRQRHLSDRCEGRIGTRRWRSDLDASLTPAVSQRLHERGAVNLPPSVHERRPPAEPFDLCVFAHRQHQGRSERLPGWS
jgi:hypothetical protein